MNQSDENRFACFTRAVRPRCSTRCWSAVVIAATLLVFPPAYAGDDDPFATNARLLASMRNDDGAGVTRALHDGAAVNSRNRLGESALLMALKKNRADLAQLVLDAGADVNEAAINGVTPLMAAAYAGNVDLTRTLPNWALAYSFDIVLRGREATPFEEEVDDE